jgi:uncharacterized membrane protein YgdD (TMEM256/DUF423 family)
MAAVTRDFPILLAATFVVAQIADAFSAMVVARELNPLIGSVSPIVSIALKVGLICFVLAVVEISRRQRTTLARVVLVVGIVAGFAGALSNTDLTPFRG